MIEASSKRIKSSAIYALGLYFVVCSIPGLLGIESNSSLFIAYQAVSFMLFWLYTIYAVIRFKGHRAVAGLRFIFVYVALLVAVGLYTTLIAFQDGDSILSMAQFFLPPLLALTFMFGFGHLSFNKDDIYRLLRMIVIFLVLASIYNLVINFEEIMSLSSITNSYQVDLKGFFYNRNVFSFMMATGLVIAVYLWSFRGGWLYPLSIIIMAASLISSMSRGGLLLVGIFLTIFLIGKYGVRALGSMVVVLSLLGVSLLGNAFVQDNIVRSDNGDTGRSSLRDFGLQYYAEGNLIFGEGQRAIAAVKDAHGYSSYHNLYVETIATQGLIGLLALVIALIYSISRIILVKKHDNDLGLFLLAYFGAFVVYVLIEALPLFYATPNSVIVTYILIILPVLYLNSVKKTLA